MASPNPADVLQLGLQREAHLRKDAHVQRELLAQPDARVLPFWQQRVLHPDRWWLPVSRLSAAQQAALLFLGRYDGCPTYTLALEQPADLALADSDFADLRVLAATLPADRAHYCFQAKGLLHWHAQHGFCAACGGATAIQEAGHSRRCQRCGQAHFPRTDPAIIVAVTHEEKLLLGRQAIWPEKRYSVLAGFVEPGETLEQAVVREVMEEAGIGIRSVRYFASQPWPFPASLMLAFFAEASTTSIELIDRELQDARWLSRDQLRAAVLADEMRLPTPASVSHSLLRHWYEADGRQLAELGAPNW